MKPTRNNELLFKHIEPSQVCSLLLKLLNLLLQSDHVVVVIFEFLLDLDCLLVGVAETVLEQFLFQSDLVFEFFILEFMLVFVFTHLLNLLVHCLQLV